MNPAFSYPGYLFKRQVSALPAIIEGKQST
jgi:hypothetical protein